MKTNEHQVLIQIGKNGIKNTTIEDILGFLKKNKEVRVKFLRSFLGEISRFEGANEIISKVSEKIKVEKKLVGNVLLLKRKQNI